MTRLVFRDQEGRPVAGAVVSITAAPGEVTDLGYITDDGGGIAIPFDAAGQYGFALTRSDGARLTAEGEVRPGSDAEIAARPA